MLEDVERAALSRVGVVIVAYASESTLRACLDPLPRESLGGVVVVDNDSPDASASVAASVPGVRVVHRPNHGFGAGCNAGAEELPDVEFLLFLNPDASIECSDIGELVRHLDAHPRCALVAPRLYREAEPLHSWGHDAGLLTELRQVVPARLGRRLPARRAAPEALPTGDVAYVEGACFLARRRDLVMVGGFDEDFFLFFEELDLARRLRACGRIVALCPSARAQHVGAFSRRTLSDAGRSHMLRSTVLYLSRRGGGRATAYVAIARASLWLRAHLGGLDPAAAQRWRSALSMARR